MSDKPIPRQSAVWDERRNSSRVFPVPPEAWAEARAACRAWAAQNPAHYQWLLDGHPALTDAEHVARFGEPYVSKRSKSSGASPR